MNLVDVKLKTLAGLPIYLQGIDANIVPFTIREILDIGWSNFHTKLGFLTIDEDSLGHFFNVSAIEAEILETMKTLSSLELILLIINFDNSFLDFFLDSLYTFIKQEIKFDKSVSAIKINEKELTTSVYKDIVTILQIQYCLKPLKEVEENPATPRAAALLAKKKELAKKVARAKRDDNGLDITFFELLSSLGARGNGLSIQKVLDLTLFQAYDQFNRISIIDNYRFSMQGAMWSSDKVEIEHWAKKID